jgi:hypothetical protein
MEENQMNAAKQAFVQWGIPLGLVNVAIYGLVYSLNAQLLVSVGLGVGLIALNGAVLIWALIRARKAQGGYASFRSLFSVYMGIAVGIVLFKAVFDFVLYTLIDPTLSDQVIVWTQEKTVAMMESMGTPDEEIDKAMAKMESMEGQNLFTPGRMALSFFSSLLLQAVLAAIFAAIFKKNKPLFAPADEA